MDNKKVRGFDAMLIVVDEPANISYPDFTGLPIHKNRLNTRECIYKKLY